MKRATKGRALRTYLLGLGIGSVILVACPGRSARAADGPLLVAVEAPPALDADAAEIRRAIGTELHSRTVAPMKAPTEASGRALIIALDRDRIAMSLRTSDAAPVVRVIPAPSERAARLRAIAWLAGNLARDQVSPIIAEAAEATPAAVLQPPSPAETLAPTPPPPSSSGTNTAMAPPAAAEPIEPPAFESTAATVTTHPERAPERQSSWTVGVAAGPAISTYETAHSLRQSIFGAWSAGSAFSQVSNNSQTVWRVEVQHHGDGSRSFTGLALEGSSGGIESEVLGAMAFAGSALQLGGFSLKGYVGAGIDAVEGFQETVSFSSSSGAMSTSTTGLAPGLYAAGNVAVSHPIFESIDLVLSLDAHLSVTDENDGYIASMLGLRYRLQ
jgi:hypothetical protein